MFVLSLFSRLCVALRHLRAGSLRRIVPGSLSASAALRLVMAEGSAGV
ncbi:hypothetical protein [Roseateles amylovorans]|uniref:Uncharacterized protein n=1 Tax=Roseateles amylovorans TaxID=2978473 RepID=A0ABY6AVG1_9BURK|nr:hypothetical protein [Roseateles amylovorans]UXH76575.1 hypothetical protein N4261_16165 [Roseateles amylovorans]